MKCSGSEGDTKTIYCTFNYKRFRRVPENRDVALMEHSRLNLSLDKYGFIPDLHVVCAENPDGTLDILFGQHRFELAEKKGEPIWYTIADTRFDIAEVEATAVAWTPWHYARRFANEGNEHYQELLSFVSLYDTAIMTSCRLLSGVISPKGDLIKDIFRCGRFEVTHREFADKVAGLYVRMRSLSPELAVNSFLIACAQVSLITKFDPNRLITRAAKNRHKLVPFAKVDQFLDMLESIYNSGGGSALGLKAEAKNAKRRTVKRDSKLSVAA